MPEPQAESTRPSRGYWSEVWRQFRRRKLSMLALVYVIGLSLVALLAPAIAGTRPIVCSYKGQIYFPCLAYFNPSWEPAIFFKDRFRQRYPANLKRKDPASWAIWPLVFQDPLRRVRDGEWEGQPENPSSLEGSPNRYNLLGTNQEGIDVFAQMVHGTTIALLVGFVSMGIATAIGVTLGASAGYGGGWIDIFVNRLIEVVLSIPTLVLILALIAIIEKPTIWHIMIVIGLTNWTTIARLTRAEFLKLRESEYVMAARAIGAGPLRIMFRYILPNALAPILVPVTFGIAAAILTESALSFLGIGPPPPYPSWGSLLNAGRNNLQLWWLILFPGLAVFLAVMSYNLIGDGLQDATDPRLRDTR